MWRLWAQAIVQHALGRRPDSDATLLQLIEKHADIAAFQVAEVQAARGEVDRAFEWLERAYAQRDPRLSLMKPNPRLRSVHGDPRWNAFLKRMGLSDSRD